VAGELRELRNDVFAMQAAEYVYEDPAGVAAWALQEGRDDLYQEAMGALYEDGSVDAVLTAVKLESIRTAATLEAGREHERNLATFARERPDLESRREAMVELAAARPDLRAAIERGGADQVRALDELYKAAGASQASSPAGRSRGTSAADRIGAEWAAIESRYDGWNI
jgi:hypothetical protein